MNIARLRKRLERLEHVLKAPIGATQPSEPTCEHTEDHLADQFRLMRLRMSEDSDLTPEEKAELERLDAMYPEEPNPLTWEEMVQIMEHEYHKECQAQKKRRR
jgi:hypothetical protein